MDNGVTCSCESPTPSNGGRCFNCYLPSETEKSDRELLEEEQLGRDLEVVRELNKEMGE